MESMGVRKEILVPATIILGGLLIAIGVYIVRSNHPVTARVSSPSSVRPVDPTLDHILGSPSAPVAIIEYADVDCEYCKQFHETLEQLMTEKAAGGKVAWVYRQFPITDANPYAVKNAAASECAATLGSVNTFWRFLDAMHAVALGPIAFNPKNYPALTAQFGIDTTAFNQCLTGTTANKKVQNDYENALASGATSAPYSIILIRGGSPVPISGAIPYAALKRIIDDAISKASP